MKRKDDWMRTFRGILSLRVRLVLAVAAELVVCILISVKVAPWIIRHLPVNKESYLVLCVVIISVLIGALITAFLSRIFFNPIRQLREAMTKVAEGDFSVCLQTTSSATEIRDMYDGFNRMVQELRSTEILQTDFVSNVSHEIKTPLSAIEGYSVLLQDGDNLTPEQRGYVEKILFNTNRLSTLTGGILLLSKLENQAIPTKLAWFSLDEQIRQTIVALESHWEKKDIEFDVDMAEVNYYGNESLMGHVWSNLLGNAVKFSPQGGQITVRLWEDAGKICFTVTDNGPGIRPEAMKYIFSKFYQADRSHKQEGNGLGLALVSQILRLENGLISAVNLPEGGCRFRVELKSKK